jgi:CHAD domain-containing protein
MVTSNTSSSYRSAFGAAAREIISRLFELLMINLPGTREGSDVEALHDMRVASRRIRASLKVFKSCFPRTYSEPVENDISAITRALGQVRDQDVFIDHLRSYTRGSDKLSIRWLIDRECQIRDGARIAMLSELEAFEQSNPADKLYLLLENARRTKADSRKLFENQFGRQAYPLIIPRLADICMYDTVIVNPEDVAGLHAMRISAKKLRYTLETFVSCFGEPMQDAILHLKTMQDFLGQVHDCDVWVEKLTMYSNDPGHSAKRLEVLQTIISRMSDLRNSTYTLAVEYWGNLRAANYAEELTALVM